MPSIPIKRFLVFSKTKDLCFSPKYGSAASGPPSTKQSPCMLKARRDGTTWSFAEKLLRTISWFSHKKSFWDVLSKGWTTPEVDNLPARHLAVSFVRPILATTAPESAKTKTMLVMEAEVWKQRGKDNDMLQCLWAWPWSKIKWRYRLITVWWALMRRGTWQCSELARDG